MRPGDHASKGPGGTDGSAGASQAQAAVAPAQTAPEGNTDSQAGQPTGAVWDQPLPWAAPSDGEQKETAAQPTSPQAESPAPPADPTPASAEVREESGADAEDDGKGDAKGEAEGETEGDAGGAGDDSSVALWQAAVSEQQRGAHAAPAPVGVTAAAGHAVSKWLLGVAVAAGGLLAAVGVAEGLGSHSSAATAKEQPKPILPPANGLDEAGTPTPSPTPTPTTTPKGHDAARSGKAAALPHSLGLVVGHAPSGDTPTPTHKAAKTPERATVKSSVTQQSSYLSASRSVDSSNPYWSKSSVTVTTTKRLTALKVVVRIYQNGGVANTGVWTSLGDKVTVHSAGGGSQPVDYVVTLNQGVTVEPGTYVFQFGYNHDKGTRDTSHDLYTVVTTAAGEDGTESRQGRF